MNHNTNKAWRQYEAGKDHKRRIGLFENARKNEAFYRGDQWQNGEGGNLPRPVFNIIRRVVDYLVSSVASSDISIRFTDENLPYVTGENREILKGLLATLESNTAYRWESEMMDYKLRGLLTDAAVCGDGFLFCYWDPTLHGPDGFRGDIVTDVIDAVNVFPADANRPDIQSQEYIIVSGRASVASLRAEALAAGVTAENAAKIVKDGENAYQSGALAKYELEGEDEEKATFIVKFWKEDGVVCFEKSTKDCIIRRVKTACRLYPLAYVSWISAKNSFHGASPVSAMIPNQKFINRAYAMAMKHMTDTAFSKVIYDKSKIPEWSNEVGEAIAAQGGGNISDAVSVVGTGEMQDGFITLIESAVALTKELMGATESALGNLEANNTSAILALQETSRITLDNIRQCLYRCVEELADVWTDMMCAYYPSDRLIPCIDDDDVCARTINPELMRASLISARVDVSEMTRYSAASAQNMLDKLLDGGHITPAQYIRRLPSGMLIDRQALINEIETNTTSCDAKGETI